MAQFRGITFKLTGTIIAAVLGTAVALTVITSLLVSYTLKLSLKTRAVETSKIIAEALSSVQQRLAIRTDVTASDENFQTTFAFKDVEVERLQKDLSDRLAKNGAHLALIADASGKAVTSADSTHGKGATLTGSVALEKVRATDGPVNTVEALGSGLYFVSAVPIKRYGEQTLGYLVTASAFDAEVLSRIQKASGAELFLISNGKLRGRTAAPDQETQFAGIESKVHRGDVTPVEGITMNRAPLIASAIPLLAGDKVTGALVFALSGADARSLQRRVLGASIGLAALIMLLSGLLGLFLARRIADPIVEIEHSFREIAASGDLSRRITKNYDDEVGRMAESFNQMQGQIEQLHARVASAEQRMRDELKMASTVQEMLFSNQVIDGARCQIACHLQTSTETGGDWYTVLHTPERHVTTIIIADVTGHGAPAALVTAILHGFFKATQDELSRVEGTAWEADVKRLLGRLNKTVIESTRRSLVATLFIMTLDHRTLTARYMNAGHLAPVIVRMVNGKAQVTSVNTPPSALIGDRDEVNLVSGELKLQPGDLFALYTDGLIECTDAEQEMYGFKRLRKVLQKVADADARTARDLIIQDALSFFNGHPNADDVTLVVGRAR